jgi:hypothetical protein
MQARRSILEIRYCPSLFYLARSPSRWDIGFCDGGSDAVLKIETSGSWHEIGKQQGEKFADELVRCADRFVGLMESRRPDLDRVAASVRPIIEAESPHLLEETAGMAEGSGMPEDRLFKLRFYGIIAPHAPVECSVFAVVDGANGVWLGRTNDIEPEDHWSQTCEIRRPDNGFSTITTSYLCMPAGGGINEHGFAMGSVSAAARDIYGTKGTPAVLLLDRILNSCRTVAEANEMMKGQAATGKGQVWLAADATGASALYPVAPGRVIEPMPREAGKRWQGVTNFQPTPAIPSANLHPHATYNSWARYGVISHRLGDGTPDYSEDALKDVLRNVANPGPSMPEGTFGLQTAYASLANLAARTLSVSAGNPNEEPFEEFSI